MLQAIKFSQILWFMVYHAESLGEDWLLTWHELTAKSERKVFHKEKHFPQSGQHTAATK
jgi:hypothetical protein